MPPGALMVIAWTVLGAAWLVVHAFILVAALRASRLAPRVRWLALLPPAAPIVGWFAGARPAAVTWVVLATLYTVLRLIGLD